MLDLSLVKILLNELDSPTESDPNQHSIATAMRSDDVTRGKANPLTKGDEYWKLDITRGKANPIMENEGGFRELPEELEKKPFAVFVLVNTSKGVACSTRPIDKEVGEVGLPGGKLNSGETPEDAVIREAWEEGWQISGKLRIIASKMVNNNPIVYYQADYAQPLDDYKEKYRGIVPTYKSVDEITNSGFGNSFIADYLSSETINEIRKRINY